MCIVLRICNGRARTARPRRVVGSNDQRRGPSRRAAATHLWERLQARREPGDPTKRAHCCCDAARDNANRSCSFITTDGSELTPHTWSTDAPPPLSRATSALHRFRFLGAPTAWRPPSVGGGSAMPRRDGARRWPQASSSMLPQSNRKAVAITTGQHGPTSSLVVVVVGWAWSGSSTRENGPRQSAGSPARRARWPPGATQQRHHGRLPDPLLRSPLLVHDPELPQPPSLGYRRADSISRAASRGRTVGRARDAHCAAYPRRVVPEQDLRAIADDRLSGRERFPPASNCVGGRGAGAPPPRPAVAPPPHTCDMHIRDYRYQRLTRVPEGA